MASGPQLSQISADLKPQYKDPKKHKQDENPNMIDGMSVGGMSGNLPTNQSYDMNLPVSPLPGNNNF
jgi:hypothetical protein